VSQACGACPKNESWRFFFFSRPTSLLQRSNTRWVHEATRTQTPLRTKELSTIKSQKHRNVVHHQCFHRFSAQGGIQDLTVRQKNRGKYKTC